MTNAEIYQQRIKAFKAQHGIGRSRMAPSRPPLRRGYEAGQLTRLTNDWNPGQLTADADIRFDTITLRNRARQMETSNEWVAKILRSMENNILADEVGFSLQMKATYPPDFSKQDTIANAKIEQSWAKWSQMDNCTIEGEDTLYDVLNLCLRSAIRDGGCLIRKFVDPKANEFGFALKLIEIDYLDHNYTTILGNGNYVIMGVEKTPDGRRVAYWLFAYHPGDLLFGPAPRNRIRVPASEIIHYFFKERITQSIGVPRFAPAMIRLRHLREYEIAEIIAAREAANKGGYWSSDRGDTYKGEDEFTTGPNGPEKTGTIADSEPGMADEVPPGMTFTTYDPQHPTQQFGDFVHGALLGAAAGVGLSYMSLTGDLRDANYGSMRGGSLDEREGFKKVQSHMIRHILLPIFKPWLEASILSGAINLPFSKLAQFNKPRFKGRRWPWIDPLTDIQAAAMGIDALLDSRTNYTEQTGVDLEDLYQQLEDEKTLADEHGLEPVTPQTKVIQAAEQNALNAAATDPKPNGNGAARGHWTPTNNR